jgi:hypothetical protein
LRALRRILTRHKLLEDHLRSQQQAISTAVLIPGSSNVTLTLRLPPLSRATLRSRRMARMDRPYLAQGFKSAGHRFLVQGRLEVRQ